MMVKIQRSFTKDGNFQLDLLDKITQFPNINIFKKFELSTFISLS